MCFAKSVSINSPFLVEPVQKLNDRECFWNNSTMERARELHVSPKVDK